MIASLANIDVSGRRLVVRADLNLPMDCGRITDATRLDRFAAGMRPLLARGAALVVLSHFGRPKAAPDPDSVRDFSALLAEARSILWDGPLGAFEVPPLDAATSAPARAAATLLRKKGVITVAALKVAGVSGAFTYVSFAGGAFLEWPEGRTLPGIAALTRANHAA